MAEKVFAAMEFIPGAAKYGTQGRCEPPAGSHPGDKSLSVLSSFPYKGVRCQIALDFLIKKIDGDSRMHNLNVEGGATFENKLWAMKNGQKKKKMKDSTEEAILELVEMRFE